MLKLKVHVSASFWINQVFELPGYIKLIIAPKRLLFHFEISKKMKCVSLITRNNGNLLENQCIQLYIHMCHLKTAAWTNIKQSIVSNG